MMPTIEIPLPSALLERAHIHEVDEAQKLITSLLEKYVQELEQTQLRQAYESYYATRTSEDVEEERTLLTDFAWAGAKLPDEQTP